MNIILHSRFVYTALWCMGLLLCQTIFGDVAKCATIEGKAQGKVSNLHGSLGESFMDNYYKKQGWEKLQGEVGRNGIDGLYVKSENIVISKNGVISKKKVIKKVLISESKFGASPLGGACSVQQMTHAWTVCKLNALEKENAKQIKILEGKIENNSATPQDKEALKKLEAEERDLNQIRRHIGDEAHPGSYRRRMFRTKVVDGELRITIRDVHEENGVVNEKTPDLRSKIETGKATETVKGTRTISLKKPPSRASADYKVYQAYFDDLERGLQSTGMSKTEAKQAVSELQIAYRNGTVISSSGKNGQAAFLREKLIVSIDKELAKESDPILKTALRAKKTLLTASKKMNGIIDTDALLKNMDQFKAKRVRQFFKYRPVKYVRGVLSRGGKLLVSIPKGLGAGFGAGLVTVAFDAGSASLDYVRGQILRPEFERNLADAAIKGGTVGLGTGVAVALGASPIGLVVIGIGVGGYIITDLAVTQWHRMRERKYLSDADLAVFGITMKDTIPLRMDKWNPNIPLNMENWSR